MDPVTTPPPSEVARLTRLLSTKILSDGRTWLDVATWAALVDNAVLDLVLALPWHDPSALRARARFFHELHEQGVRALSISLVFRQGSAASVQAEIAGHARRLAHGTTSAASSGAYKAPPPRNAPPASPPPSPSPGPLLQPGEALAMYQRRPRVGARSP
jgi:hypothetical protein